MNSKIYLIILGVILLVITPLVTWILVERTSPPLKIESTITEFEGTLEEFRKLISGKYPSLTETVISIGGLTDQYYYTCQTEHTWGHWKIEIIYEKISDPSPNSKGYLIHCKNNYSSKIHTILNNSSRNRIEF